MMTIFLKKNPSLIPTATLVSGLMFARHVYAEPSVSSSVHILAWVPAISLSFLLSWLVVQLLLKWGFLKSPLKKRIAGIILLIIFLMTVAPIVAVLASIMISGRTM